MTTPHAYLEALRSKDGVRLLPTCSIRDPDLTPETLNQATLSFMDGLDLGEVFELPRDMPWDQPAWWEGVMASAEAMASMGHFRLPYPVMVVRHEQTVLVIAEEDAGSIGVQCIYTPSDKIVTLCGVVVRIVIKPHTTDSDRMVFEVTPTISYPHEALPDPAAVPRLAEILSRVVMALVVLLSCRGVSTTVEPAPEKLNRKRLAKKKPLIRRVTRIHLRPLRDPSEQEGDGPAEGSGKSRRSPRIHLRRGHIVRRGRDKHRVWISPVIVGLSTQIGRDAPVGQRTYVMPSVERLDLGTAANLNQVLTKSA